MEKEGKVKPQPKWFVLQIMNFVVMGIFVGSITYLFINYKDNIPALESATPITNMFFPLMFLMTLCLAYLFGFFGISFIDKEALTSSPSSFGLNESERQ